MDLHSRTIAAFAAATVPFLSVVALGGELATPLEEVVVTATLQPGTLDELPASITVIGAEELAGGGAQHFGDLLGQVPNVTFAGGTARPRYFQIRGIGELEQYEGAPNPSVGFVIDDIDFSGISMPAQTFDMERAEVLRGPQGTAYGANALAGLINLVSRAPQPGFEARAQLEGGNYGVFGSGVVLNDALGERAAWRVAAHTYRGDGFRRNAFLGRDDTERLDETFVRARLRASPREDLEINLVGLFSDVQDGYDSWAVDNTRVTRTDRPGVDAQRSRAAALRVDWTLPSGRLLRSVSTVANSDIRYSFDGDWGNDAFWGPYAPNDFFQDTHRDRRTWSQELRLASAPGSDLGWVAGVYALRLAEGNRVVDEFNGDTLRELESDFVSTNLAAYAQVEQRVGAWTFSAGLRGEQRRSHYEDSLPLRFDPRDTMLGGHLSARRQLGQNAAAYLTLSRGYKAGGFNLSQGVPDSRRVYDPEFLWNVETGLDVRSGDGRFEARGAVFYMRRTDQQVGTSVQPDPEDPLTFVFFTDNAARGENYGVESQVGWYVLPGLRLGAALGLLRARFVEFEVGGVDVSDADPPHAPRWTYGLSAEWRTAGGFFARAELDGVDDFAFSASHRERSSQYHLVHARVGYEQERWSATLWARNLLDREYATRGFFFGLEPPDYPDRRYVDLGDPRQVGVTVSLYF